MTKEEIYKEIKTMREEVKNLIRQLESEIKSGELDEDRGKELLKEAFAIDDIATLEYKIENTKAELDYLKE